MEEKWEFNDGAWWEPSISSIKFPAARGKDRVMCIITHMALNDYFETEDSEPMAFENFEKHKGRIHALAVHLIEKKEFNDKGEVFITLDIANKYAL